MAPTDSLLLLSLRVFTATLGGVATGLLLSGPLLITPTLFTAPGSSSRLRLHLFSRLQSETSSLAALVLPLLTAALGVCALLVQSADPLPPSHAPSIPSLAALVAENRKTLYTLSAVLTLALRPYSFGLLAPRIELLKAEERRVLLLRSNVNGVGARTALGLSTMGKGGMWRGGSPVESEGEGGNESDEEDNAVEEEREDAAAAVGSEKVDTDALIRELSRLQLGAVVLAGGSFALTLLELGCA
ncbi:hypothetical protein JCM6882_000814 [Rhodosporidiobolus microsporus]